MGGADILALVSLAQMAIDLAMRLCMPGSTEMSFADVCRHRDGMRAKLRSLLEKWHYPSAFMPASPSAAHLASQPPMRLSAELAQEFAFWSRLGLPPPVYTSGGTDRVSNAPWADALAVWLQGAQELSTASVAPLAEASSAVATADLEAGGSARGNELPAATLSSARGLPTFAALLELAPAEAERFLTALTDGGALRAMQRRYLCFALRVASIVPAGSSGGRGGGVAAEPLPPLSTTEVAECTRIAEKAIQELSFVSGHLAYQEGVEESRKVSHSKRTEQATLAGRGACAAALENLKAAIEMTALRSLFATDIEASIAVVVEYDMVRSPIMSFIRFFAGKQLEQAKAAVKTAKTLFSERPLDNPIELVCEVFRMYSTPDVEKRFRHQLQAVEAWWNAQTQMRLPGPAQRATSPPSGLRRF